MPRATHASHRVNTRVHSWQSDCNRTTRPALSLRRAPVTIPAIAPPSDAGGGSVPAQMRERNPPRIGGRARVASSRRGVRDRVEAHGPNRARGAEPGASPARARPPPHHRLSANGRLRRPRARAAPDAQPGVRFGLERSSPSTHGAPLRPVAGRLRVGRAVFAARGGSINPPGSAMLRPCRFMKPRCGPPTARRDTWRSRTRARS